MTARGLAAEDATDIMYAARGWEHVLMVKQSGSVQQQGWVRAPGSSPYAPPDAVHAESLLSSTGAHAEGEASGEVTHDISIPDEVVVAVAAGEAHSAALTASGQVFVWGSNASGASPLLQCLIGSSRHRAMFL